VNVRFDSSFRCTASMRPDAISFSERRFPATDNISPISHEERLTTTMTAEGERQKQREGEEREREREHEGRKEGP